MSLFFSNCGQNSEPTQHEFTAFDLSDLQAAGVNGSVGCGDTFTMPGSATVSFDVTDDDGSLSGDWFYWWNDNAIDRSFQTASIEKDGEEVGNGRQIYAEKYFAVTDENGNHYIMVEIEQEGSSENYYTFLSESGPPPAGAVLTVGGTCNVFGNWVNYDNLGAGDVVVEGIEIIGTSGADNLVGTEGDDTIIGRGGRDVIDGAGGNDFLQGDGSADTIFGGDGDDIILPGRGASDTMTGGAGSDTFRFENGFGTDTITDFEIGSDVIDLFEISLIGGFDALTITDSADGAVIDTGEGVLILNGVAAADLSESDFIFPDNIEGTDGDDTLIGTSGNDVMIGFDGNDTLIGRGGRDFMDGGAGDDFLQGDGSADTLIGGSGNDILEAGRGAQDTLTGGADADTFRFQDGFGSDTITDFEIGIDVIDLEMLTLATGFADLTITDSAEGARVDTTQGLIILEGIAAADVSETDFLI